MQFWYIIYPKRDRTKLDIVCCWDYERGDYDIASTHTFSVGDEDRAQQYALELAEKHGLTYVGERDKLPPKLLD